MGAAQVPLSALAHSTEVASSPTATVKATATSTLASPTPASIQLGQVAPAQPNPPSGNDCFGCTLFQSQTDSASPTYVAPVNGTIKSWSVQGPSDACPGCVVRLRIFRQTSPGVFLTVADSADQSVSTGLNTYTANIPVRAGDMLGIRATNGIRWYAGNTNDKITFIAGEPTPGASTSVQCPIDPPLPSLCYFFPSASFGNRVNVAATLVPFFQIGQVGPAQPNSYAQGCTDCTSFQSQTDPASPSYASPIDGTLNSWSVQGPTDGCPDCFIRLRIFRQTPPGEFTTVAQSAVQRIGTGLNTFAANIPVRAGDMLGIDATNGLRWYPGNGGDRITFIVGDPSPGSTTTGPCPATGPAPYLCRFDANPGNFRAYDNSIYLCYVNLVGGQDELVFDGNSMVFDAAGEIIARGPAFEEALVTVDLDIDLLTLARIDARMPERIGDIK